ncbi:MAG: GntR family transcriptional regulator [Spirochaetia bacterium]
MQFEKDKPIYAQIVDRIIENILQNKWKPEERIPSVREMAIELEVNPNTVVRSYSYLQEQGVIYNQRGIGYFVSEDGKEQAKLIKRTEFIEKELPYFFRTLQLLGMDMGEVEQKYITYKKKEEKGENQ